MKFNATKIPKKKDAIKFTIEIFCILNPMLILKFSCINILSNNPIALPNKTKQIE